MLLYIDFEVLFPHKKIRPTYNFLVRATFLRWTTGYSMSAWKGWSWIFSVIGLQTINNHARSYSLKWRKKYILRSHSFAYFYLLLAWKLFILLQLHQEFLSDQQKIRTELLTQFKDELDTTRYGAWSDQCCFFFCSFFFSSHGTYFRAELEDKYRESLKIEIAKLADKHKRELTAAKKKQWCWQCESEVVTLSISCLCKRICSIFIF